MKTKNIILILIILVSINFKVNAQCPIDAGEDKTIICGDSVQLNAGPVLIIIDSNDSYNRMLFSIFFTDNLTSYAVGINGPILKTSDGGNTWAAYTTGGANLKSVYFPNANTGYAVGYQGTILKTSDSGTNWIAQTSGTPQNLQSVYFTDANTGYAVGWTGIILKTSNGGTKGLRNNNMDKTIY